MKTSDIPKIALAPLLQLFLLVHFTANAQQKYDFRNASRISGTSRQVGALYVFQMFEAA